MTEIDLAWVRRLVQFAVVGASGVVVHLGVVAALEAVGIHWGVTAVVGWFLAVTWNFGPNWRWTFGAPEDVWRRYARYVVGDLSTTLPRLGVVWTLVTRTSWAAELITIVGGLFGVSVLVGPQLVGNGLGIGVTSIVWFVVARDWVFES